MTITLKKYTKSHPATAHAGLVLCTAFVGLIATHILDSTDYSSAAQVLHLISILLAVFAIYLYYRARKTAKKEYLAEPPTTLDAGAMTKNRLISLAAVGLMVANFIVPMYLNGDGIDHKLDASQGFDEANYQASFVRARAAMTPEQVDAFNWAVTDLSLSAFIGRYGKYPTSRTVIQGEADRQISLHQDTIRQLENRLAGMGSSVQENEQTRAYALELLKTVVAQSVAVNYSVGTTEQKKNNSLCLDVVCSNQGNDTYPPRVWYTIDNKNNLQLSSLPCTIEYSTKTGTDQYTKHTECLKNVEKAGDGSYTIMLQPGGNDDFTGGVATIIFDYENAKIQHPAKDWLEVNALPEKLTELQQLENAKRALEKAEAAKATVLL